MWSAYQSRDVAYVGGLHDEAVVEKRTVGGVIHGEDPLEAPDFGFEMIFGCQNKITGLFKTQLVSGNRQRRTWVEHSHA